MNIIKAYAFRFAMLFVNGLTAPYLCYSKFGCFFMPIFHMLASGSFAYNFWGVPSSLEILLVLLYCQWQGCHNIRRYA